jgi:hypothetical protein
MDTGDSTSTAGILSQIYRMEGMIARPKNLPLYAPQVADVANFRILLACKLGSLSTTFKRNDQLHH